MGYICVLRMRVTGYVCRAWYSALRILRAVIAASYFKGDLEAQSVQAAVSAQPRL